MDWNGKLRTMPASYKPDTIYIGADESEEKEDGGTIVKNRAARPASKRLFGPNGEIRGTLA